MTERPGQVPGHLPDHLSRPPNPNPSAWNPAAWTWAAWSLMHRGAWGEAHLALDAIVAYVDDELSPSARGRATEHLSRCRDCVREVVAQLQARSALRSATAPALPGSLLATLRSIPQEAELPPPPPGLAVGPDGALVSVMREPAPARGPAQQLSQRAVQLPLASRSEPGRAPGPAWVRLGASAAVGVALGVLVAGAMPFHPVAPTAPSGNSPSLLDARLRLGQVPSVESVQLHREPGNGAGSDPAPSTSAPPQPTLAPGLQRNDDPGAEPLR